MAVKATFEADFSSFLTAVDQAEVKLVEFQSGAGRVEASLSRMVDSFSGRKVIQDATLMAEAVDRVGGVSKLTETELGRVATKAQEAADKLRAMGQDVPPKIQTLANSFRDLQTAGGGIGDWLESMGHSFVARVAEGILLRDVIREVISFAHDAVTDAAKLEDLAKATGVSVAELQRLNYVGLEFGVTSDIMARAVEQLSAKLANGDKNATTAVQMLGLNVQALIAKGPAGAFLDIADAVGRVEDPMARSGLAAELFGGRLGKTLLPALSDLRQKMAEVPQAAIISDENVQKAHDFDVGLQHLETTLKAVTVSFVGWLTSASNAGTSPGAKALAALQPPQPGSGSDIVIPPTTGTQQSLTNAQLIQNAITALRTAALEPLTLAQQTNIDTLNKWGASASEIAKLVTNGNVVAVDRYLNGEKALAKQLAETDAILMSSFEKRTAALKAVTEANLKAYDFGGQIASLNQLMASEEALARSVYNQLTSERDRAKVIEELTLRKVEIQNQINAIEQKHAQLVNAQIIAELDARRQLEAAVGRNIDGSVGELSAYEKLTVALKALHLRKQEGISQYEQEQLLIERLTTLLYGEATAREKAAAAARGQKDIFKDLNDTALMSNDDWLNKLVKDHEKLAPAIQATTAAQQAAKQAFAVDLSALSPESGGTRGAPGSFQYQSWQALQGMFAKNNPPQARAGGGPVDAGMPYLVGEKGPELFTPSASGAITPNGASGAPTVIQLVVDGRVLSEIISKDLIRRSGLKVGAA